MLCPNCRKDMFVVERYGIEVDFCPECKGIFFDKNELKMLSEALAGIDFEEPDEQRFKNARNTQKPIKCPYCDSKMDMIMMDGKPPVLDYCPNGHGIFFESGELAAYVKNHTYRSKNAALHFLQETFSPGESK